MDKTELNKLLVDADAHTRKIKPLEDIDMTDLSLNDMPLQAFKLMLKDLIKIVQFNKPSANDTQEIYNQPSTSSKQ